MVSLFILKRPDSNLANQLGTYTNHIHISHQTDDIITTCSQEEFTCIILEVGANAKEIYAVANKLKSLPNTNSTPILLVFNTFKKSDYFQLMKSQWDDFIVEPFSEFALIARINHVLKQKRKYSLASDLSKTVKEHTYHFNQSLYFETNSQFQIKHYNQIFQQMYQFQKEDIAHIHALSLLYPDENDLKHVLDVINSHIQQENMLFLLESPAIPDYQIDPIVWQVRILPNKMKNRQLSFIGLAKREEKKKIEEHKDITLAPKIETPPEETEDDLEQYFVREIQELMIPRNLPQLESLQISGAYLPKDYMGGDLYDVQTTPNGVSIILSDVYGKGIPAVLLTSIIKIVYQTSFDQLEHPRDFLEMLNKRMNPLTLQGLIPSLFYAFYHTEKKTFTFTSAGYIPQIIYVHSEKKIKEIMPTDPFLSTSGNQTFNQLEFQLAPNDLFFLFTDGLIEVKDKYGEILGMRRLKDWFSNHLDQPVAKIRSMLISFLGQFCQEGSYDDDIAFLIGKVTTKPL